MEQRNICNNFHLPIRRKSTLLLVAGVVAVVAAVGVVAAVAVAAVVVVVVEAASLVAVPSASRHLPSFVAPEAGTVAGVVVSHIAPVVAGVVPGLVVVGLRPLPACCRGWQLVVGVVTEEAAAAAADSRVMTWARSSLGFVVVVAFHQVVVAAVAGVVRVVHHTDQLDSHHLPFVAGIAAAAAVAAVVGAVVVVADNPMVVAGCSHPSEWQEGVDHQHTQMGVGPCHMGHGMVIHTGVVGHIVQGEAVAFHLVGAPYLQGASYRVGPCLARHRQYTGSASSVAAVSVAQATSVSPSPVLAFSSKLAAAGTAASPVSCVS